MTSQKSNLTPVFLAFCLFFCISAGAEENKTFSITIPVYQVTDPNFSPVSAEEITKILSETKTLSVLKFGVNFYFEYKGELPRVTYLKNYWYPEYQDMQRPPLPVEIESYVEGKLIPRPYWMDVWGNKEIDFSSYKKPLVDFLIKRNYTPEQLTGFFPEEKRDAIHTLEDAADAALEEYKTALTRIKNCTYDGKPVLDLSEDGYFQSATAWYWMRYNERQADKTATKIFPRRLHPNAFVLYNGPILEDETAAIHGLVKGFVNGTTGFVSMFTAYSNPSCVQETLGAVPQDMRHKVVAYILLHEMGHTFFELKDDYKEENLGCVMYVGPKVPTMVSRYHAVAGHEACSLETKNARRVFKKVKWLQEKSKK